MIKSKAACFQRAFSARKRGLINHCSKRLDSIIKTKTKATIIIRVATRTKAVIKDINSSTTEPVQRRNSAPLTKMKTRIPSGTTLTQKSRQATSLGARSLKK